MAEKLEFELVSPEKLLISEPVEMVVVPGTEGYFGALPGHAPMLSTVAPGVIEIYENNIVTKRLFVAGGFAEVTEARCTVLAEEAVAVEAIDVDATRERLKAAREALQEADDVLEQAAAQARIRVAEAMLAAAG